MNWDDVLIQLIRAIRVARNQADLCWIRFGSDGWPDEVAVDMWLYEAAGGIAAPAIAWPTRITRMISTVQEQAAALPLSSPIEGRPGWRDFHGRDIRDMDLRCFCNCRTLSSGRIDFCPIAWYASRTA